MTATLKPGEGFVRRLIIWMKRRAPWRQFTTSHVSKQFGMWRYAPFWYDESISSPRDPEPDSINSHVWTGIPNAEMNGKHWNRPPWFRPFNILLHCWMPKHDDTELHDHPRWSVTIVLKGVLIERTPWKTHIRRAGNIVIRSRKYIHAITVPPEHHGRTWTLFIVGRRSHKQNVYFLDRSRDRQIGEQ